MSLSTVTDSLYTNSHTHTHHIPYTTGDYQVVLGKVAHYSAPMVDSLRPHGLPVANGAPLDPDDVKFFLKQQQKCLADAQGSKEESIYITFTVYKITLRVFSQVFCCKAVS